MNTHSRRQFLKNALLFSSGAALVSSPLANAFGTQNATRPSDYKALVCIDLAGGNDGTNTLVPFDDAHYAKYQALRGNLALEQHTLLSLNSAVGQPSLALHPKLPKLQQLYNQGHAAFIANVGPMIDHLGQVGSPPKRGSHSNQSRFWKGVDPTNEARDKSGWLGRLQDNANHLGISSSSVNGKNEWQNGQVAQNAPYIMDQNGPKHFFSHTRDADLMAVSAALADDETQGLFSRTLNSAKSQAKDKASLYHQAMNTQIIAQQLAGLSVKFPNTGLGKQLKTILKVVLARETFSDPRQTFYAKLSGFDTHANQSVRHNKLLKELDDAIFAFNSALLELGLHEQVTTFSVSDFGRTTKNNGSGTDHGWGNHHWVIGGAVQGQQVYGQFPSFELDGVSMTHDKGILIPSTSVEQYSATLARWFGAQEHELANSLPHLAQFSQQDLGFIKN